LGVNNNDNIFFSSFVALDSIFRGILIPLV
jgi:hypothetical protein